MQSIETIPNAIGGRKVASASKRSSPVFNPATGEQTAMLPLSELSEINAAVAAAKKAANVLWSVFIRLYICLDY